MSLEKNLDFDTMIERKNTDCLKYDFAVKRGRPADVLPLWVADMDFQTSSRILEELQKRIAHGVFGYTESGEKYFEALAGWMEKHHGWKVEEDWLIKTPGVVFALAMAVKAYTNPGDAVLIQQPVYYPFTEVVEDNDRRVVSSDLVLGEDGRYQVDFEDFERKIIENQVSLFLLCSPHNPVGRVWTREELTRLGEICLKHQVVVVADEIHADFVFGDHRHVVFADLSPELEQISVTCTSPAKTFNLAGLQISNILIPNEKLRKRFQKQVSAAGYSQANMMGLAACEAAYQYGEEWYEGVTAYLAENMNYMQEFLERELPELRMLAPEGTYLVWVDFKKLGLAEEDLEKLILEKAHLWLDSGAVFGKAGEGFERFNVACSRKTLEQALKQLKKAVRGEN